jgi:(p)ppGpp synthase/HD superfamily hydrolase
VSPRVGLRVLGAGTCRLPSPTSALWARLGYTICYRNRRVRCTTATTPYKGRFGQKTASASDLEERAASLSRIAHAGQEDKAGRPYIEHPAAVVRLLSNIPEYQSLSEQDQQTARATAWFHDVVEDTAVELQDLHVFGFPETVIMRVSLLTETPEQDREAYCRAIVIDPVAFVVKLADNAHNSDPERLALLDPAARDRLDAKYGQDRAWLGRAG